MASRLTAKAFPSYWPYPLTPKAGELLSSWLARNSFYTGLNPCRFCQRLFPNIPIWDRDVDRFIPNELIEKLSILSGVSNSEIEFMTFGDITKKSSQKWTDIEAVTPMILSIGMYGRNRSHFGLQYCPYCLKEDPYYRKHWRYAFNTYCEKHGCSLLDACPTCRKMVIPHKAERVELCWNCGENLSQNKIEDTVQTFFPKNQILSISSDGMIDCNLPLSISSAHMLRNLRGLIKVIVDVDRDEFVNRFGAKKLHFELLRSSARKKIIKTLEEIMGEWPASFHKYMNRNGVTQRKFSRSTFDESVRYEIDKLPIGRKVHRVYNPVVYTHDLKKIKRRSISQYRTERADLLLKDCMSV